MIVELRGLVAEWDDGKVVFLGAVEQGVYEAICEDDRHEGTNRWEQRKQEWIDGGPHGIGETREIEIRLSVPNWTFATPEGSARSLPVDDEDGTPDA